jgi:protease I
LNGEASSKFLFPFATSTNFRVPSGVDLWLNRVMQAVLLAFVGEIYEDLELWYPKLRLEEAGYTVRLAGTELKTYQGKHGYPATAELLLSEARSADFAGLLIPGGFMPDRLRRDARVLALTREFFEQGKLVAFICHGGWIPISAKILRGRRATGSLGIKDDLENAGAVWVDEAVVVDGNLISSRTPVDLPAFAKAMVQFVEADARTRSAAKPAAGAAGAAGAAASERTSGRSQLVLKKGMLRGVLK